MPDVTTLARREDVNLNQDQLALMSFLVRYLFHVGTLVPLLIGVLPPVGVDKVTGMW